MTSPDCLPSRWSRLPMVLCGAGLALAGFLSWHRLGPSRHSLLFWLCMVAMPSGLLFALSGILLRGGFVLRCLRLLSINVIVLALLLALMEAGFRAAHFDFETKAGHREASRADYPPCFRQPDKPLDEVFFQRRGPDSWTGRPLATLLRLRHGTDHAYDDEAEFTADYDHDGFRNPAGLQDWDVAVAGDSYTELGFLPSEKLPVSILAASTGLQVKNLGVCNTGPLTQTSYLKHFGGSASCKHAVLAFYEGNDIFDAEEELRDLKKFRATGVRPIREQRAQSSFILACYRMVRDRVKLPQARSYQDAWFTAAGRNVPITIHPGPLPVSPEKMTPSQNEALKTSLDGWAAAARDKGMKPWLLYLPLNNRIYADLVRFDPKVPAEVREWKPHDMPEHVEKLCQERGIAFINSIPKLRAAAVKGTMVFNAIYDTHLNEQGALMVGKALAEAFKELPAGSR